MSFAHTFNGLALSLDSSFPFFPYVAPLWALARYISLDKGLTEKTSFAIQVFLFSWCFYTVVSTLCSSLPTSTNYEQTGSIKKLKQSSLPFSSQYKEKKKKKEQLCLTHTWLKMLVIASTGKRHGIVWKKKPFEYTMHLCSTLPPTINYWYYGSNLKVWEGPS